MAFKFEIKGNKLLITDTAIGNEDGTIRRNKSSILIEDKADGTIYVKDLDDTTFGKSYRLNEMVKADGNAWASMGAFMTWADANTGFNSAATAGSVAQPEKSTNLIFDANRIVGTIPRNNATTTWAEGSSLEIAVDPTKQYWIVRDNMVISGSPTTEQYKAMAAHFKDASGNVLAPLAADIYNFTYTLKSKKITPPAGAVKMILVLTTNTGTDLTGNLSVQEAVSDFVLPVEPEFTVKKNIETLVFDIFEQQKIDGAGVANATLYTRSEVISVKDRSVLHIELNSTPTLFGALVAMYDANMTKIGEISASNGNINLKNNAICDPVKVGDKFFISVDTRNFSHFTVCSYSNSGQVAPVVKAEKTPQVLQPELGVVKMTNLVDPSDGGLRNTYHFQVLTEDGDKINFKVGNLQLCKAIGFGKFEKIMLDKVTGGLPVVKNITDFGIADFVSFRCKIGGVQDLNFTGHGDTVVTTTTVIENEKGIINPSVTGRYIDRGSFFKVTQTGRLDGFFTPRQQVATFKLEWYIFADGSFMSKMSGTYTTAIELTNNYSVMGLLRNGTTNVIQFDTLKFDNALPIAVAAGAVRQYYDTTSSLSGWLSDSLNNFKADFRFYSTESNHPSTSNDKLSYQSETGFAKMYRFDGLGNRAIGNTFYAESEYKFSRIS